MTHVNVSRRISRRKGGAGVLLSSKRCAHPSARASKVWQRPRGEVMPTTANLVETTGVSTRLTPEASARLQSVASCSVVAATLQAASAAEHAVSMERQLPRKPRA